MVSSGLIFCNSIMTTQFLVNKNYTIGKGHITNYTTWTFVPLLDPLGPMHHVQVYRSHNSSSIYWLAYTPFRFAHPFLPFTQIFLIPTSAVCMLWGHHICATTRRFTDPEASLTQLLTCISTTGRPTRIQTWDIGSSKLGFSLPLWLTN
eukprot:6011979-Ditylum_brightwellii.AAC.2